MSFLDDVERCCRGLEHISSSPAKCCETCQSDYGMDEDDPAWDELCDEGGFSWHSCDTCGSSLGGNRYTGHGFTEDGDLVHLSMCADCLVYFANGDVPDEASRQ